MTVGTRAPEAPAGSRAWYAAFAAVLTLGMAVATAPQFVLGALAPVLIDDLGVSRVQLGAMTSAFFGVSALTSALTGRLGDRLGGRRLLLWLYAVAGATFAAMAAAPTYPWLLAAVSIGGLASAAGNPATNDLIARHLPEGRRGGIVGTKQSGVQVGGFVAGAVLLPFALEAGWRAAALSMVAWCAAGGVAAAAVVPHTQRQSTPERNDRAPGFAGVGWQLSYAFFMGAGMAAVSTYLVLYATEALGVAGTSAGTLLAVMAGVAVVARIVWGGMTERIAAIPRPLAWLAAGSIASTVLLMLARPGAIWLAWIAAFGLGVSGSSWNAVGMLAIVRGGSDGASRASGSVLTGFFVGLLVMPLLFGVVVDGTGSYRLGWAITAAAFVCALAVTLGWGWADARTARARSS